VPPVKRMIRAFYAMPDAPTAEVPADLMFLEPGPLSDGELSLVIARRQKPDPIRGWCRAYYFEIRLAETQAGVGQVTFRAGHSHTLDHYSGHIGYGVNEPVRGRHFAEKAVRLLLPFIRRHGYREVWITCNPDNLPSRRTCERLGARFVEIVPLPPTNDMYLAGERMKCRYRLDLGEAGPPVARGGH
jgi:predicted acetyltransferase